MPKEQYIDLCKFQVLQRISSNDLQSDMDIMKKIDFQGLKTYLAFRDELMKDLEKNEQLFENNPSPKRK